MARNLRTAPPGSSASWRQGGGLRGPAAPTMCLATGTNRQRGRLPMTSLFQILMLLIDVAFFIVLVHVIMSWLINFGVLNIRQPLVAQIWDGLNRLLEPVYGPIRRALPQMGWLDLAPLIVILGLYILEIILRNNVGLFL
jgi:YggT family protein